MDKIPTLIDFVYDVEDHLVELLPDMVPDDARDYAWSVRSLRYINHRYKLYIDDRTAGVALLPTFTYSDRVDDAARRIIRIYGLSGESDTPGIPPLEEFTEAVREKFASGRQDVSPEDIRRFIAGTAAQSVISARYRIHAEIYEAGSLTREQFLGECALAAANFLQGMYGGRSAAPAPSGELPTLDEFTGAVRENLASFCGLSENEISAMLDNAIVRTEIKNRYSTCAKRFELGNISRKSFLGIFAREEANFLRYMFGRGR